MAVCNQLDVRFDYRKIDETYDFYSIATIEKYIPFGAKCLDVSEGKIESLAFENGKSLYVMLKKGKVSKIELVNLLDNDKLSIKKIESFEIPEYILFRLFLYSLNNFASENLSFNNLTGKFYIFNPAWMKKNRSSFTAIGINVDNAMNIIVEAATFAKYSLFKESKKLKEYPKYVFANKNCSLRRVFDTKSDEVYIKKGIYNKKAEIPFFIMDKGKVKDTKAYYLYYVLDLLKQKYESCLAFDYKKLNILETIGCEKDKEFMARVIERVQALSINLVNYVDGAEYEEEFLSLAQKLQERLGLQNISISKAIDEKKANILLIHNKEYYEQLEYPDPYKSFKRSTLIQCITVEDSAEKIINDNEAIINTILKEIVVKDDILNARSISLDSWADYKFESDWVFGKEKDGIHYYMVIHPNGSFDFYDKADDFSSFDVEILNRCSDYLTDNKGKEKTIFASNNNNICIISRTNRFPLPSKAIFEQEVLSRSKQARDEFLSGVVDINLYEEENSLYYSVGIKGYGMNFTVKIRAPHLYKIDVISGENIMPKILSTLSATFVKYKSFTVLPYPIKYLNEYILMTE